MKVQEVIKNITLLVAQGNKEMEYLEQLGKFVRASRSYIFFVQGDVISNTYEWCNAHVQQFQKELEEVPYEAISRWIQEFRTKGYMLLEDIETIRESSPLEYSILKMQSVMSLITVPIYIRGVLYAFIGVDDPEDKESSLEILKTVATVATMGYEREIYYNELKQIDKEEDKTHAQLPDLRPRQEKERQVTCLNNLLESMSRKEFYILYQPKVELQSGKVVGAEALIRYKNEKGELVGPDMFIPYYEERGPIYVIDFYVLTQVIHQIKACKAKGQNLIPIALNICMETLLREDFQEKLEEVAREGIAPYIELEITERNIPYQELEEMVKVVRTLRKLGFGIAADDFGAGNSNLMLITKLDITTLKVDKSVIDDLNENLKAQGFLQALIEVCDRMKIQVIVEGVETKEQVEQLRQMGSKVLQGYYFSKPITFDLLQAYC